MLFINVSDAQLMRDCGSYDILLTEGSYLLGHEWRQYLNVHRCFDVMIFAEVVDPKYAVRRGAVAYDQQAAVIDCLATPAVTSTILGVLAYPGCCSSLSLLTTSANADAGSAELGAEPCIILTNIQHPVAVLRGWNLKFRLLMYRSYQRISL